MTINLVNRCQSEIYVSIDDIWDGIIGPNKSIPIECEPSDKVKMSVHVNHRRPCRGSIHNLNLITHYAFENVKMMLSLSLHARKFVLRYTYLMNAYL